MATTDTPPGDTCPRCLHPLTHDPAESYCARCGEIVTDAPLERRPPYDPDDERERHAPVDRDRDDRGLGTRIGYPSERDHDDERRRRLHTHARKPQRGRRRAYATGEVGRIAAALSLSGALTARAAHLFRRFDAAQGLHGLDLDAVAAACLLAACREDRQGITAGDVADVARVESDKPVHRRLRTVQQALGLALPPPDVAQRVRVVAGRLGVDAAGAVARVRDADCRGGSPSTLAAWVVWEASDATQRAVADAAGVTPAGMRARKGEA